MFGASNIKQYILESADFSNFLIWQNLFTNILHCHRVYDHRVDDTRSHSQFITETSGELIINLDFGIWQ